VGKGLPDPRNSGFDQVQARAFHGAPQVEGPQGGQLLYSPAFEKRRKLFRTSKWGARPRGSDGGGQGPVVFGTRTGEGLLPKAKGRGAGQAASPAAGARGRAAAVRGRRGPGRASQRKTRKKKKKDEERIRRREKKDDKAKQPGWMVDAFAGLIRDRVVIVALFL